MACIIKFLLLAGILGCVRAAKSQDEAHDLVAELRRDVKPKLDATGRVAHYNRYFVRNDRETGEYTHLIYNCSRPTDQFVSLDDFRVRSVTCTESDVMIETIAPEDMRRLQNAMKNSPSGLLYAGEKWGCLCPR